MDTSKTNSINSINSFVKTTIDDHGVALLELCRLQKRNALSQAVIDDLVSAISMVEKNVEVRAVVLTGSGGGPFSGMASICTTICQAVANYTN
jgi:enoyl-CoA hydratase